MVKVGDILPAVPLQPKKETKKTDNAGKFNKKMAASINALDAREEASSTSQTSSLAGLMHLQEIENRQDCVTLSFNRGEALLSHLENLRQGILWGAFSEKELEEIKIDLAKGLQKGAPPPLKDIVEEIEQRVHIELAKIEMSKDLSG
mgnify:CR=1 FL=1